jgi:dihydrofolate reductase
MGARLRLPLRHGVLARVRLSTCRPFSGWQAAYPDDETGEAIVAGINRMDALLLGRKTYDIFAAFWPTRGDDDPIAVTFNALPNFVVSHSLTDPAWEGTRGCRMSRRWPR